MITGRRRTRSTRFEAGRRTTGWERLLRSEAVAHAGTTGAVAIALRDLEAGALTIAVLAALALLHVRQGTLGTIALLVLFANSAFWMLPGLAVNIAGGRPVGSLVLPAAIGSIAVAGMVAALARLTRRSRPAGRSPVVVGLAALAAIAVVAGAGVLVSRPRPAGAGSVRIVTERTRFSPRTINVPAGRTSISVTNRDLFWHTFTVSDLDVDLRVPTGGLRTATFDAPAGRYRFVCAIPGHESAGMRGTLVVG